MGCLKKNCYFLCLRGFSRVYVGSKNFPRSSTLSLVFSSCGFSSWFSLYVVFLLVLLIFRVSIFSSSFLFPLSSLLVIFFSFFFLFKQWLFLQALVLLQTQALLQMMMRSYMTWIKRLQCFFMQGLLIVLLETCSS